MRQGVNPSQSTHTYAHSHNSRTLISLICMFLDSGRQPTCKPDANRPRDSQAGIQPRTWRCKAIVLTTKPQQIHYLETRCALWLWFLETLRAIVHTPEIIRLFMLVGCLKPVLCLHRFWIRRSVYTLGLVWLHIRRYPVAVFPTVMKYTCGTVYNKQ